MEIVEIVQPSGKLDSNNLNLLHNEIQLFLNKGIKMILLDFQDVTCLEQDSLIILKAIFNNVQNQGGKIYLCSLNEEIKNLLETTNTKYLFNPLENRQEFEEKILAANL